MEECEQDVAMFIKGSAHLFPRSDNVNKISAYFTIFKKILTNQANKINDGHVKNQNQRESYEERIKEKNNEICNYILITLIFLFDTFFF